MSLYEVTNGEAFLLSAIVRNINLSLAAGGNSGSVSLQLTPTGATQSIVGQYQRFTPAVPPASLLFSSGFFAQIPEPTEYQYIIKFIYPALTLQQSLTVGITQGVLSDGMSNLPMHFGFLSTSEFDPARLRFADASGSTYTNLELGTPAAGDEVTLAITPTEAIIDIDGELSTLTLPTFVSDLWAADTPFNPFVALSGAGIPSLDVRVTVLPFS
jgi:hypothetical protein